MASPAEQKIFTGTHSDYFLKLDGIPGESQDKTHKDEIQVLNWSIGAAQATIASVGGTGGGAGKVKFQDFRITKPVDKSSPKLMLACASGQHFPNLLFTARRAGGTQADYWTMKLQNVLVSSYETNSGLDDWSGSGGAGASGDKYGMPVDAITFNFGKIDITYNTQNPDGTKGAAIAAGWDLAQNVKSS
jgi:type VI secretion system secreted protein Hcp